MPIYTFYCRHPGGHAPSFEAYALEGDQAAAIQAQVMLEQHMSAHSIEVYDGDRRVLTRSRTPAGVAAN